MDALKDMKAILARFLENINSKFIKKQNYGSSVGIYSSGSTVYNDKYSGIYLDGNRATPTVDVCSEQVRVGVNGTKTPFVTKYIWSSTTTTEINAHQTKSTGYANMPAGYIPVSVGICYDGGMGNISFKLDDANLVSGTGDDAIYNARILMTNVTATNFNAKIRASVFCVHHTLYSLAARPS